MGISHLLRARRKEENANERKRAKKEKLPSVIKRLDDKIAYTCVKIKHVFACSMTTCYKPEKKFQSFFLLHREYIKEEKK